MVYGFTKFRCTEAVWDKFINEGSKNSSEISEGAYACTEKSHRPVTSVPET